MESSAFPDWTPAFAGVRVVSESTVFYRVRGGYFSRKRKKKRDPGASPG